MCEDRSVLELTALQGTQTEYAQILETAIDGFWVVSTDGRLLEFNRSAAETLGYSPEEMRSLKITDIDVNESPEESRRHIEQLICDGYDRFEARHRCKNGDVIDVEVSASYVQQSDRFVVFTRDITSRKRDEAEREITIRLLGLLNQASDLHDLMREVTTLMHAWSGCEAVGIRLREGDDFPYFETRGFPPGFVQAENSLCATDPAGEIIRDGTGNPVLECMCGNVLRGCFDPALPFFTVNGSFWTNSTTELLASTSEADRQARTRNRCNGEGFESVALIPLRHGSETLGLLQFNDARLNRFTAAGIALYERLAANLAIAVAQRQSAQALRESAEELNRYFTSSLDMLCISSIDGRFLRLNPQWEKTLGYPLSELAGRKFLELVHPNDREATLRAIAELSNQHEVLSFTNRYRCKDGRYRWIEWRSLPKDKLVYSVARDVTEQRRQERIQAAQLRLIEFASGHSVPELLRRFLDEAEILTDSEIGFYHFLEDSGQTVSLQAWSSHTVSRECRLTPEQTHYPLAEAGVWTDCVKTRGPVIHNDYAGLPHKKGLPEGHAPICRELVVPVIRRDKVVAILGVGNKKTNYDDDDIQSVSLLADLAWETIVRMQAEEALRKSEARLQEQNQLLAGILQHTHIMAVYLDPLFNFVWVNRAYAESCRHDPSFFRGKNHFELYPHEENLSIFQRVRDTGQPYRVAAKPFEFLDQPDRGITYWDWSLIPVKDDTENVVGLVFSLIEVTERIQAEAALIEEVTRRRALMEASMDGIAVINQEHRLVEANQRFCEMLGYSPEEVLNLHTWDWEAVMPEADIRSTFADFSNVKRTFETRHRRKDGSVYDVEVSVSGVQVGGEWMVFTSSRDITERKRAEEILRDSLQTSADIVRAVPSGFFIYQYVPPESLVLIDGNPEAERLTGLRIAEWIGHEFNELWPRAEAAGITAKYLEAVRTGQVYETEDLVYQDDRVSGAFRIRAFRLPGERLAVAFEDISERKRAEEGLRVMAQMLDVAPNSIIVHDAQGQFLYANKKTFEIHGYDEAEFIGLNLGQLDVPQSAALFEQRMRMIETRGEAAFEVDHYRKDGTTVPLEVYVKKVTWGGVPAALSIATDITERKKAEEALRESERRYRAMFENNRAIKLVIDPETGRILEANSAACEFYQYSPDELAALSIWDLNTLGEEETRQRMAQATTGERTDFEFRHRLATGELRDVQVYSGTVQAGERTLLQSIIIDMTERKQAEQALRESEERLRLALDAAGAGTWEWDIRTDRNVWSDELWTLYGLEPGSCEPSYETWVQAIHPEDRAKAMRVANEAMQAGKDLDFEWRVLGRDHTVRWIMSRGRPLRDPEGRLERYIGIVVDITERKQAEAERERLMAAIEQAGEVIVITDASARIQYVNPAFERTTGYSRDEAVGQNPRILQSGHHDEAFYRGLWDTLTSGRTWQGRFVNKRKNGSLYTEDATISPVCDAQGHIVNYVAVKRDITSELALEEQYRQAQKMEAVGQLTGGVAHDFNNLLQVINGGIELTMMDLDVGHPANRSLSDVLKAGERAASLVQQLLLFSRQQILRPKNLNLNTVVEELLKMLRRVIGEHIRLNWIPAPQIHTIFADRGMVEQAVMNLCINARDAMPEGGALTIETADVRLDARFCADHAWAAPGTYARISVTDTGCGMDADTLEHIFEPFFTTKEPGQGTGLGLSTVFGVVKQHEGLIHATSEPGQGSTFHLYFPIASADADTNAEGTGTPKPAAGGNETILLAEDDDGVRGLAGRLLRRAGYTVIEAANGREAVAAFEAYSDKIDMVLLDVVMPEMGGRETYERIRARKPDARVLFVSGYSENAIHTNFVLNEGLQLLQKPYAPNDLLHAVREMLSR